MQSGGYTLDDSELSINEIVEASANGLKKQAGEAAVTIELHRDASLPPTRGDSAKLKQVVTNILSNAIKFTPSGGHVSATTRRQPDGGISIIIVDSGVGMTQEEVDIALAPFGQVDGARSRWREGTGLGLPIARALVELHGGEIAISSTKGSGTEVAIRFPSRNSVSALSHGVAPTTDELLQASGRM